MTGDVKRWSVTYTKHIKQKRKVYQDGFLEVDSSSHKVTLYDDCEKVLGSKFIKIKNDVESGKTLAFDSYLVDIGDLHGDHKHIVNKTSEARDKHIDLKPRSLHNHKFRNNSAVEDRKPNFREKKTLSTSLSPSQKLIREFKKGEVQKYSSSPSCLDVAKSCEEEWQVLYTTQLTQKAKKFHDGFLRILMNGSQSKKGQFIELRNEATQNGLKLTDEQIWYLLVESPNAKNRVPGVGDYEREMKKMNSSVKSHRSTTSTSSAAEIASLKEQNQRLQEEFANFRSNLSLTIQEEIKKLYGDNPPPRDNDDEMGGAGQPDIC